MIKSEPRKRRPEFKQLAFETAIRNPERYKDILSFMKEYDGILLTDENLLTIVSRMYIKGLVRSANFNLESYNNENEIKAAVKMINSTRRADGGFPQGYQSRFWTYMRTLSEFGFVYARYNEIFKLGDAALKLINNEIDPQEAFSLQAMKYNRRSPYRNVLNDYNYFKFIINVLKKLKKENRKLSFNQFIISLFSKDGNVDAFLDLIKNNTFNDTIKIYEYLMNNFSKLNTVQTVISDYPDVVLRMLRITGFVNIEYKGILLIDLNENNLDYINNLLTINYDLTENEKNSAIHYFNRINTITDNELNIILNNREETDVKINYNNTLSRIIDDYQLTISSIKENLIKLCNNGRTDERFKYIPDPLQFEFFLSLFMYKIYGKELNIKPNYKVDANGMPISHAPGNMGDIEITSKNIYWLVEATLIKNKTQQLNNETTNLFRHISADNYNSKYLSLVAPHIHEDTQRLFEATTIARINGTSNFSAKPYNIVDFINISENKQNFHDMVDYTKNVKKTVLAQLINSQ